MVTAVAVESTVLLAPGEALHLITSSKSVSYRLRLKGIGPTTNIMKCRVRWQHIYDIAHAYVLPGSPHSSVQHCNYSLFSYLMLHQLRRVYPVPAPGQPARHDWAWPCIRRLRLEPSIDGRIVAVVTAPSTAPLQCHAESGREWSCGSAWRLGQRIVLQSCIHQRTGAVKPASQCVLRACACVSTQYDSDRVHCVLETQHLTECFAKWIAFLLPLARTFLIFNSAASSCT